MPKAEEQRRLAALRQDADESTERVEQWAALLLGREHFAQDEELTQALLERNMLLLNLRMEMKALRQLMIKLEIIGEDEWYEAIIKAAHELNERMSEAFAPWTSTTEKGLHVDISRAEGKRVPKWMRKWRS